MIRPEVPPCIANSFVTRALVPSWISAVTTSCPASVDVIIVDAISRLLPAENPVAPVVAIVLGVPEHKAIPVTPAPSLNTAGSAATNQLLASVNANVPE